MTLVLNIGKCSLKPIMEQETNSYDYLYQNHYFVSPPSQLLNTGKKQEKLENMSLFSEEMNMMLGEREKVDKSRCLLGKSRRVGKSALVMLLQVRI